MYTWVLEKIICGYYTIIQNDIRFTGLSFNFVVVVVSFLILDRSQRSQTGQGSSWCWRHWDWFQASGWPQEKQKVVQGIAERQLTSSLYTLLKSDVTRRDHVSVVMDPMNAGSRIVNFIVNFIRDGTVFA